MRRRAGIVALVVAALAAPAACSDDGPATGEAHLEVDGRATVERADGERDIVDDSTDLAPGDRVAVSEGIGRLELADGVRIELRAGFDEADDSVVLMDEAPELEAGEMLVSVPESAPFTIEAAGTAVEVESGSARVARTLGMAVDAYDADVNLDSAGQERRVPALRQMQVPALGRPPQAPRPVEPDGTDPWDQRLLGAALELDRSLTPLEIGYTRNLRAGEGRSVGFLKTVYPSLESEPELTPALVRSDRRPGDTLVGAAITQLGERGSFAERWDAVFGFHEEGATWGLVALDQAVRSGALLDAVTDAIASSPLGFTDAPLDDELAGPPDATDESPPTTAGGESPPGTSPPGTSPTTPPTVPPTTSPPPVVPVTLPPGPLAPVVTPLVDLVNGLLGGLLGGSG